MRRVLVATSTLALALVVIGGLWPATSRDDGSGSAISAIGSPLGFETPTAKAVSIPTLFSLDDPATVRHNDRQIFYRGQVECTEGDQLRMRVSITQGDTEGRGQTIDRCTGDLQAFEIRVAVRGPHTFQTGELARYEGWAGTFSRGSLTAERVWDGEAELLPEVGERRGN